LTERRRRWGLAACLGSGVKSGPVRWLRQRTSEARQRSWCAVENAVTGRPSTEELRSRLHQARAGSFSGLAPGFRLWLFARGVVVKPKLERRRQARLYLRSCRRSLAEGSSVSREGREALAGALRNRTVQRVLVWESVAEVGETHLSGRSPSRGNLRQSMTG